MAETNYKSIEQYAELCGISTQAVYKRLYMKKIKTVMMQYSGKLIDINKYPPVKRQQAGRRKNQSVI